jgi:hypothetical protein
MRSWGAARENGKMNITGRKKDWGPTAFTLLVYVGIALVALGVGFNLWFKATHHCVRSHLEDVEGYFQTTSGGDSVWIPAHIERVCDAWEKNK